ncbi:unnamed protein product, partial [Urochloa humidicola]
EKIKSHAGSARRRPCPPPIVAGLRPPFPRPSPPGHGLFPTYLAAGNDPSSALCRQAAATLSADLAAGSCPLPPPLCYSPSGMRPLQSTFAEIRRAAVSVAHEHDGEQWRSSSTTSSPWGEVAPSLHDELLCRERWCWAEIGTMEDQNAEMHVVQCRRRLRCTPVAG